MNDKKSHVERLSEKNKPLKILVLDLAIADIPVYDGNKFIDLLRKYGIINDGNKTEKKVTAPSPEVFDEILKQVTSKKPKVTAGGTAANMVWTMKKLLGEQKIDVDYYTAIGKDDEYGELLSESVKESGMNLQIVEKEGVEAKSARSLVLNLPDTKKILTDYGSMKEVFTADSISDEKISEYDVFLLQASLYEKLEPVEVHQLVKKCSENNVRLWLSYPTREDFINRHTDNLDVRKHMDWLAHSAELVLCNRSELRSVHDTVGLDDALTQVQNIFQKVQYNKDGEYDDVLKHLDGKEQSAFITLSGRGVSVFGADDDVGDLVPPRKHIIEGKTPYFVGAGDTSTGAFFAGYIAGLEAKKAAQIAMNVVARQLLHPEARYPKIDTVLQDIIKDGESPKASEMERGDAKIAQKFIALISPSLGKGQS